MIKASIARIRQVEISTLFKYFIIYSAIGWLFETVYCFIDLGVLTKRGFLFGPICPIYGLSLLIMIMINSDRTQDKIPVLVVRCGLITTVMEYITSLWMEKVFDKRWWDYSHMFMNINGRVCIGASLLFGICGALFVKYFHPAVMSVVSNVSDKLIRSIDMLILVIFLFDILLSIRTSII
ncbi:MAG: putative ABC transporter permease [Clostridiales bacterium]|nr:putative ABC transporter permease [Clostridiales bacterium]